MLNGIAPSMVSGAALAAGVLSNVFSFSDALQGLQDRPVASERQSANMLAASDGEVGESHLRLNALGS